MISSFLLLDATIKAKYPWSHILSFALLCSAAGDDDDANVLSLFEEWHANGV